MPADPTSLTLAAVLTALVPLVAAAATVRCQPLRGLVWALAGWASVAVILGVALPRWSAPWTAVRLAEAVAVADPAAQRPLADAAWGESSLPLLSRRPVLRLRIDEVDSWLAANPGGLALVPAEWARGATILASIEGIDLVHGRRVNVALVTAP